MKNYTFTEPSQIPEELSSEQNALAQVYTSLESCEEISGLVGRIRERLPHAKILGATAGAKILNGTLTTKKTVISITVFDKSQVHTFLVSKPKDVYQEAVDAARVLTGRSPLPPKAALIFSDGLHMNGDTLLKGLSSVQPELIVSGGMASDDHRFKKTMVFNEDGCTDRGFVMAFLYGDSLDVFNHYSFNWVGLGKTFKVTRSEGTRVWELDNIPIIDIYKKYLGDEVADCLPDIGLEFPLILVDSPTPIARAVMVKHEDGSLSFAGSVKQGSLVRFGFGDAEGITEGVEFDDEFFFQKPVEVVYLYNCIARLSLVGDDIEQESLRIQRFAPTNGFFTYGEFYHASHQQEHLFLNQTLTVLAMSEHGTFAVPADPSLRRKKARKTLVSGAMSHFVRSITSDMEKAIAAEKQSKEIMLHKYRQASIGETIEIIAHQWRQPLNIISLVLQDIFFQQQLGNLSNELINHNYEKANSAIQYLSQTIDDFRSFMRPENDIVRFTSGSITQEALALIRPIAAQHKIVCFHDIDQDIQLQTRKNALLQTILIVAYNAIDAIYANSQGNGKINIHTTLDGDYFEWTICDNGGGVPHEYEKTIFEPYFSTKGHKNGTGMGLYIAQSLARHYMGGEISHKNRDGGACFTIRIKKTVATPAVVTAND